MIPGKYPDISKLNNALLNNPWAKGEISGKIRKLFEWNENENTKAKPDGSGKRNRQIYNYTWRLQYFSLNNRTSRQKISVDIDLTTLPTNLT